MASHEEQRRTGIRLTVLQYLLVAVFSILAVSFWALQVVQHAKFQELAENNNQRTIPLRAPRAVRSTIGNRPTAELMRPRLMRTSDESIRAATRE